MDDTLADLNVNHMKAAVHIEEAGDTEDLGDQEKGDMDAEANKENSVCLLNASGDDEIPEINRASDQPHPAG